jgi:hypothetical protein
MKLNCLTENDSGLIPLDISAGNGGYGLVRGGHTRMFERVLQILQFLVIT